jgi:phenylalanyl-tRNA synthetase beta chain
MKHEAFIGLFATFTGSKKIGMKISYNWLRTWLNTPLSPTDIADILTDTGLEVEGVDTVETVPGGLNGLVVGHVVKAWQHPDADRLRLTMVNIGEIEEIQIVCGAPNVAEGQKVIVAMVGAKLYPSEGDPFVIKKGKIRGEVSMGMICAEDEIGLGEGHDGIMVLDASATPGTPASVYFELENDSCFEIGLTPNRTDAISHRGVARDLHAALRAHAPVLSEVPELVEVSLDNLGKISSGDALKIEVENKEACPRYAGITIDNIQVGPSPEWLQRRLVAIGLSPINNVVDITNFVMHDLGQPLHAFDADKIEGGKIVVKNLPAGTKFTTLDNIERELDADDLMICDTKKGLCIAGVFGGKSSGITEKTTRMFLESAYFNPVSVRTTARRHGLNTDASFRFERGVDPNGVLDGLLKATSLICQITGGTVVSELTDLSFDIPQPAQVKLNWQRMYTLIGKEIPKDLTLQILDDLDIDVITETDEDLGLEIPTYRQDVTREADVIEEILRIYGYNNIEIPTRLHATLSSAPKPDEESLRNRISDLLTSRGATEIMCNSLTKSAYLELVEDPSLEPDKAVRMLNPLSSDLDVMRQTLLFQALETVERNQNQKKPNLRLYEFGRVYKKADAGYQETSKLALTFTGLQHKENWNKPSEKLRFSHLKAEFDQILGGLGLSAEEMNLAPYQGNLLLEGLTLQLHKKDLGFMGIVHPNIQASFGIKDRVLYAEINWDALVKASGRKKIKIKELEKYPAVRRDLSLLIDTNVQFADLERVAKSAERKMLKSVGLFDVYEGDKLEAGKKSYAISLVLQDEKQTLQDKQIDLSVSRIKEALEKELGAQLRK